MDEPLLAKARKAAQAWGTPEGLPKLIAQRENTVFRVRMKIGHEMAIRLHRPGYQSDAAIREEMMICEGLADAAFACPWPFRTLDKEVLHILPDGTRATAVQWIEGQTLEDMPPAQRCTPDMARTVGALLADLHVTSDTVLPASCGRPDLAPVALSEPPTAQCPWLDDPALTPAQRDAVNRGHALAQERLNAIPASESGLIHGDVQPSNMLMSGSTLFLIDFDDCGSGYRLYDLAAALLACHETGPVEASAEAIRTGYLTAGGPLRPAAFADLPVFLMLCAQARTTESFRQQDTSDPQYQAHRARALALTEAVLSS